MAFENSTATDPVDLLDKLNTFAAANGWTTDYFDDPTGRLSLSINDVFVNFLADTGDELIMCSQALGFAGTGINYYLQTDDSGGTFDNSSPFSSTTKHINLDNTGPYQQYWFFEDHAAEAYIHVVVQTGAFVYRHFSFGELVKFGDWTGGEYMVHNTLEIDEPLGGQNSDAFLWDGCMSNNEEIACTIHAEDLPGQLAAEKWLIFNRSSTIDTDDRAGELRRIAFGDCRGGIMDPALGVVSTTQAGVFTPLRPIHIFAIDGDFSPRRAALLGHAPDVKNLNIANFDSGVEVNLGGDTYIPFPYLSKELDINDDEVSGEGGIAYLKTT